MAKRYLEARLLGIAPPTEPGEALPAAAGARAPIPGYLGPRGPVTQTPQQTLGARRLSQDKPAARLGEAGFWACPRRGWVSLSDSRMPPTCRDAGPAQRPPPPRPPCTGCSHQGGPGPDRALGTSKVFSRLDPAGSPRGQAWAFDVYGKTTCVLSRHVAARLWSSWR